MKKVKLMRGDNLESLKKLPDNSIDSVVTDPPYGLSFMNKKWDYDVPSTDFWKEVYRVLKPGGHVLSFGGTRTYHRMVVNMEDAGFEIRDQIMWLYGSGFPKSLNIGKAVDKLEGNEREVVGEIERIKPLPSKIRDVYLKDDYNGQPFIANKTKITKGTSPYEGWGTALKPANEPICLARKPISENTIVENVIKWRTGGINIDGCRVGSESMSYIRNDKDKGIIGFGMNKYESDITEGRFPANIILDEIAGELLDEQSGESKSNKPGSIRKGSSAFCSNYEKEETYRTGFNDQGGASRFFYQAKVSKAERNMGLDGFEERKYDLNRVQESGTLEERYNLKSKNNHPTVKPINLMTYLCRLITPKGGIVLDPYMGSGSTGIAALLEDFRFCGMEMDEAYFKIAESRIENYEKYRKFLKK